MKETVMAFFEWKPEYNTNIRIIDEQHKKWIGYINQLYDAMKDGKTKQVLGGILDDLADYTNTHFATEEELLTKHNYPLIIGHKQIHANFVKQVKEYKAKFESGNTMMVVEMSKNLKEWLNHHILDTDLKYAPFLIEKGVK